MPSLPGGLQQRARTENADAVALLLRQVETADEFFARRRRLECASECDRTETASAWTVAPNVMRKALLHDFLQPYSSATRQSSTGSTGAADSLPPSESVALQHFNTETASTLTTATLASFRGALRSPWAAQWSSAKQRPAATGRNKSELSARRNAFERALFWQPATAGELGLRRGPKKSLQRQCTLPRCCTSSWRLTSLTQSAQQPPSRPGERLA